MNKLILRHQIISFSFARFLPHELELEIAFHELYIPVELTNVKL